MIEKYILENNLPLLLFTFPVHLTFKDDLKMEEILLSFCQCFCYTLRRICLINHLLFTQNAIYFCLLLNFRNVESSRKTVHDDRYNIQNATIIS